MDFFKQIREQQMLDKLQIIKAVDQDLSGYCLDEDIIKGKMGNVGERRTWNGKEYEKRADGKWRPVPKVGKTPAKKEEPKAETKPESKRSVSDRIVDQKTKEAANATKGEQRAKKVAFKDLTKDIMVERFPVSDAKIKDFIKKATAGREVEIREPYTSSNTHIYDTFANSQRVFEVKLLDAGQSDVTPSGTFHSKRGISISFHVRGYWNKDGREKFSINASKDTPGGMAIYKEKDVDNEHNVQYYIESIIRNNPKNNTKNFVY